MLLILQHRRPDGDVDTYHLKSGRRYHIGRGSGCEVRILDLRLSRRHATIEELTNGWHVTDLGSTNGCRLDGKPVTMPTPLTTGARIDIGSSTLVVARLVEPLSDPADLPETRVTVPLQDDVINLPGDQTPAKNPRVIPVRSKPSQVERSGTDDLAPHSEAHPIYVAKELDRDSGLMPKASEHEPPLEVVAGDGSSGQRDAADRTYFLNLLGRHVGPLTREQARDLKSRDLKGVLTLEDLRSYPQARL
jgi:hypothetical protein